MSRKEILCRNRQLLVLQIQRNKLGQSLSQRIMDDSIVTRKEPDPSSILNQFSSQNSKSGQSEPVPDKSQKVKQSSQLYNRDVQFQIRQVHTKNNQILLSQGQLVFKQPNDELTSNKESQEKWTQAQINIFIETLKIICSKFATPKKKSHQIHQQLWILYNQQSLKRRSIQQLKKVSSLVKKFKNIPLTNLLLKINQQQQERACLKRLNQEPKRNKRPEERKQAKTKAYPDITRKIQVKNYKNNLNRFLQLQKILLSHQIHGQFKQKIQQFQSQQRIQIDETLKFKEESKDQKSSHQENVRTIQFQIICNLPLRIEKQAGKIKFL